MTDQANTQDAPKVGYAGLGLMGGPMALRLARAGLDLAVWNRNPEKCDAAVEAGAKRMGSAAEVTAHAEFVFTCLTNTEAVEVAVFGPGGIAEGGSPGKILVEMSSMDPGKAAEFADRLRTETGMGWVDCPVSGGVPGATNGDLAMMAGGSEEDFQRVEPFLLAHLAKRITHMGSNGAGQSTKLINQILIGCNMVLMSEACALARSAGLDPQAVADAISGGRADSNMLKFFWPKIAARNFALEARMDFMVKDLNMVQETAQRLGAGVPMTSLALELHRVMVRQGHGAEDNAAFLKMFEPDDPA